MSRAKIDPGIYQWKNLVNNKVYVGSSISIKRRQLEHIARLKNQTEGNEYFQRAWNKYGPESFVFSILERCAVENRLEREQFWIDKLNSTNEKFGYNLIPTRKSQLYGSALSKHQKAGWAKLSKEERRQLNLHLNEPSAKKIALERSNEVKKLKPWRDSMEKAAWSKLRSRWQDPLQREKMIAAQNEGRRLAKLRRLNGPVDEIV
jgi:group I intron endonuclease